MAGQQAGPPQTVRGTVVNAATSEPIPRALVSLMGAIRQTVFSDSGGRFEFENVPGGPVMIFARRPGFVDFETRGARPANQVFVSVSPQMKDVRVELQPTARITGRVVNEEGEPLKGISIQLLSLNIVSGRRRWMTSGAGGATGSNGQFVVENLAAGDYILHTGARALFPGLQAVLQGRQVASNVPVMKGYPARYYPDAPDAAAAQVIKLKPGEEATADMTLKAKPSYRVSGVVTGANGGTYVTVLDATGQPGSTGARVAPQTGRFAIPALFEGTWSLTFETLEAGKVQGLYAKQTIEIANADVTNLNVQMQPLQSIPVEVEAPEQSQAGTNPRMNPVQLRLIPTEPGDSKELFATRRSEAEALSIYSVPPGNYRLSVQAFPPLCVASVMSGSADLLTSELTVSEGTAAAPIHVILRSDCAKLTGKVASSGDSTATKIVAVSDLAALAPMFAEAGTDGSFAMPSLAPGDYHMYAMSSLEDFEYGNPDALRAFRGQAIHLEANQAATVTLEPNIFGEPAR